jgi:HEAT repeat protein
MNTLAEIEAAADVLPPEQKQELILFLATRLRADAVRTAQSDVAELFNREWDELFEDGLESEFARKLKCVIEREGESAIDSLASVVSAPDVNEGLAAEALRVIGRMNDPLTHDKRLSLLEGALFGPAARVRDAASVGLASLDDPRAIPCVIRAINDESSSELREDMKQVLQQLEQTDSCLSSSVK